MKKRRPSEWVAGLVSMPAYVTGEGDPYRPEVLFWMSAEGAVLGSTVGKPGELLGRASESLQATIACPMWGRPHAPERIRVASSELAAALRTGHPGIELVLGPTPEIDAVVAAMREKMGDDAETEQSYLSPEVDAQAMAAFFRAAAELFRAKPWKTVPSDQSLLSVTIEKLGLKDAALSVIGQMGDSLGFILFSGIDDFEAYLDAADAMEHCEKPAMPPHFVLNFDRGAELTGALRKQIAEHRWEVAGADAYPWLVAVDEDVVGRPPTDEEVTIAEAIALALPKVLTEKKAFLAAWNGGQTVSRTLSVPTHAGDVEVSLSAPYEQASTEYESPFDVLAALTELARDGEPIAPEAHKPLEEGNRAIVRSLQPHIASFGDTLELRVTLREIEPPIWRTVRVPADLTLGQLHAVLQVAFGWTNSHLHDFRVGDVRFGMDDVEDELFSVPEDAAPLGAVVTAGSRFVYCYDFGDDWEHEVVVERIIERSDDDGIACVDGARRCPPEDCGGTGGYAEMLGVLAGPASPERRDMKVWVGRGYDPEQFDLAAVNKKLATLAKRLGRGRRPKKRA